MKYLQAGIKPEFILFITGSEEEMERRVLNRNEVLHKPAKTFRSELASILC
jgi:hypothetical protein